MVKKPTIINSALLFLVFGVDRARIPSYSVSFQSTNCAMSLAFGRKFLSIPGPSVVPDRVLQAMHQASPNIYEGDLVDLVSSLYPDLRWVAATQHDVVIYIGNGHAAWEGCLSNTLSRGDQVLGLATGRFTLGWTEMAEAMGVEVDVLDYGNQLPVDANRLEARLRADTTASIKAVLMVQTDTASSVSNDVLAARQAIDAAGHPALLMVDCIASLGCERFEMDAWGVDVMVAACQKGLMTPAGLGFNYVGPRAWEAHRQADLKSAYWDWDRRVNGPLFYQQFSGTAPTHHLFGLREALTMLREEGLEPIWQRHQVLAEAVWAAVSAWGAEADGIRCNVEAVAHRSRAVTTITTGSRDADRLRHWCEDQAGLTLGIGLALDNVLGDRPENLFRIGHMGHLNPPMLLGTLGTVDTGLKVLGYPHGQGAVEAATATIAQHMRSRETAT